MTLGPELDGWNERPCRGRNPDEFLPSRGENAAISRARAICAACPANVKQACLEWALDHNEVGVWGQTSDRQRRIMKGNRRRRVHLRCDICGGGFTAVSTSARYCGEECRRAGRAMAAHKRPSRGVA